MSSLMRWAAVNLAVLFAAAAATAQTSIWQLPPGYYPTGPNGYVMVAPRAYASPPPYWGYGGWGYGGWGYPGGYTYGYGYRTLPPAGFGSPYYSGYNDPYYGAYGPGVQEFLDLGGADFYGW